MGVLGIIAYLSLVFVRHASVSNSIEASVWVGWRDVSGRSWTVNMQEQVHRVTLCAMQSMQSLVVMSGCSCPKQSYREKF